MARFGLAAVCLGVLVSCSSPQAAGPSSAILAMRDRFEAQVLSIEGNHAGDPEGLRREAAGIALGIYGADWSVVRAEGRRSLAALPQIDLKPYEALPESAKLERPSGLDAGIKEIADYLTPAGLAMMRFWDAQAAGGLAATASFVPGMDGERRCSA